MEQYGNTTTYNLEIVLKQNIVNSDYYRNDCTKLSTWAEIIDQIYYDVKDVEPWMGGNVRGPSSAFCLLFRLFALKPTEEDIRDTIRHKDLVYIRAVSNRPCKCNVEASEFAYGLLLQVGFLYLRYVCDPRKLWQWFKDYVDDQEVSCL